MRIVFFNDTATTEIYTLSLHDALPISRSIAGFGDGGLRWCVTTWDRLGKVAALSKATGVAFDVVVADEAHMVRHTTTRSEEHTSELQSRQYLVCRLLLEKKKK